MSIESDPAGVHPAMSPAMPTIAIMIKGSAIAVLATVVMTARRYVCFNDRYSLQNIVIRVRSDQSAIIAGSIVNKMVITGIAADGRDMAFLNVAINAAQTILAMIKRVTFMNLNLIFANIVIVFNYNYPPPIVNNF